MPAFFLVSLLTGGVRLFAISKAGRKLAKRLHKRLEIAKANRRGEINISSAANFSATQYILRIQTQLRAALAVGGLTAGTFIYNVVDFLEFLSNQSQEVVVEAIETFNEEAGEQIKEVLESPQVRIGVSTAAGAAIFFIGIQLYSAIKR